MKKHIDETKRMKTLAGLVKHLREDVDPEYLDAMRKQQATFDAPADNRKAQLDQISGWADFGSNACRNILDSVLPMLNDQQVAKLHQTVKRMFS